MATASLDEACFGARADGMPPKRARLPGMHERLIVPHPAPGDPPLPHYHFAPGDMLEVSGHLAKVVSWEPRRDLLEVVYVER